MRNKKVFKYGLTLAALMPVLVFSVAFAEQGEESEERPSSNMQQRMGQNERVQTQMGDVMENMMEARKNRVESMKKMMQAQINRAQRALERLEGVMEKIQSRRDKLSGEGADVATVDTLIAKAETQYEAAKTALDKAKSDLAALSTVSTETSTQPRNAVQTFMRSMNDLKKKMIELHRTLMSIAKEIRNITPSSTNN